MSEIVKHTGFNLGSISKIEYAPSHYFETINNGDTDILSSDIVFKSGNDWIDTYFTPFSAKYADKDKLLKYIFYYNKKKEHLTP